MTATIIPLTTPRDTPEISNAPEVVKPVDDVFDGIVAGIGVVATVPAEETARFKNEQPATIDVVRTLGRGALDDMMEKHYRQFSRSKYKHLFYQSPVDLHIDN